MENHSLLVGVGVGTLFITLSTVGLYYYQKMRNSCNAPVKNNKTKPEEALSSKGDLSTSAKVSIAIIVDGLIDKLCSLIHYHGFFYRMYIEISKWKSEHLLWFPNRNCRKICKNIDGVKSWVINNMNPYDTLDD